MAVSVEVWSARPPDDADAWDQVSCERLEVDDSRTMLLESPTGEGVSVPVPTGTYVVEISGRGFVSYGVPFVDSADHAGADSVSADEEKTDPPDV